MSITTLKLIALITMTLDHIGEFIPGAPVQLHWIGRISAPIFFFCMAWGYYYTKNRRRYLLRLYFFGVGMAFINLLINKLNHNVYVNVKNNIFVTLFLSCLIIYLIDLLHQDSVKGKRYIILFILAQLMTTGLIIVLVEYVMLNPFPVEFYAALFANVFLSEGGVPFVILGIIFYYTKSSKRRLLLSYGLFCMLYTLLYNTNIAARVILRLEASSSSVLISLIEGIFNILGINTLPIYHIRFYTPINYYWMVIFAFPIILLYNGKKGRGYKYLFYFYYPVHIYVLYFIGSLLK